MSVKRVFEVGRVLPRGQLTLPKAVRQAAGIDAGATVAFEVIDDGRVEIRVLSRLSLDEALQSFRVQRPYDEAAERTAWQKQAADDVLRG